MPQTDSLLSSATFLFIGAISLFMINCAGSDRPSQMELGSEERTLTYEARVAFLSASGDTITVIDAAVADDETSRTQGLMNVTSMPEDAGMIFIFNENRPRSFWMASTPLSLDLIFANENLEIVRIHRNASPYSQDSIASGEPAKYVVEVNAGYTLQYDINEGGSIKMLD